MSEEITLFNKQGAPLYRLHTGRGTTKWGGDPLILYDVKADSEYAALLAQRNKLGDLPGGHKVMPESRHTKEMLDRTIVAQANKKGVIDTPDKELAKRVLREFPDTVLDEGSPQDALEEVQEERRFNKLSPAEKAKEMRKRPGAPAAVKK